MHLAHYTLDNSLKLADPLTPRELYYVTDRRNIYNIPSSLSLHIHVLNGCQYCLLI